MQSFSLETELPAAQDIWRLIAQTLQGIKIPATTQARRVGIGYLHLSLEHLWAITTLIEGRHFASAFSLMRPQYEAAIRGAWFSFFAPEESAEKLLNGGSIPPIRTQIDELISCRQDMEGLRDIHSGSWRWLNDYTHGGEILIKSRFRQGKIDCAITDEHAATNLVHARRFGFVVAIWFAEVAGREDLCRDLYEHLLRHDRSISSDENQGSANS